MIMFSSVKEIEMAKFILPPTVIKAKKETMPANVDMWPVGTLYLHVPTGIYFRFLPVGGRWDTEYAISSNRGLYTMSGLVRTIKDGRLIARPDKNAICDMFIKFITA
jgi:hypothetical protein